MGCRAAQTIETLGADTLAAVTGQEWAIPLINGGISAANGGGIKGALMAGGEALAGQELLGAVGVGQGNDVFNSALGITGDNPAGTGLPDIGGFFNGSGGGASGSAPAETTNTAGATVDSATGNTVAPPATPTSVAPSSGGGFTSANAAIGAQSNSIDSQFAQGLGADTSLSSIDVPGVQTGSTPSLGSISGAASDSSLASAGSNAAIGAANTSPIGATSDIFSQAAGGAPQLTANLPSTDFSGSAPASGGATGGIKDWLPSKSDVGSFAMKAALPLGSMAYDAIKGPAKLPSESSALGPNGAATAPLLAMETSAANEAATGQLTQPQQAQVLQYVQQQQNQLIQQLANAGVQNPQSDSRYIQGMQQIQQNAIAIQQQFIQQAISEATSAGGAASNNIATVANQQIALDKDFQDSLAATFAVLGGGAVSRQAA